MADSFVPDSDSFEADSFEPEPSKPSKRFGTATAITRPSELSLSDFFPSTKARLRTPIGPVMDLLSIPVKAGMAGIRTASQGIPFKETMQSELRGGPPVGKEEGTMRFITQTLLGSRIPGVPQAAKAIGSKTAGAIESASLPRLPKLRNPFKGLSDPEIESLGQKVRQSFFGARKAKGIEFESAIQEAVAKNPGIVVQEARSLVDKLRSLLQVEPQFAQKVYDGIKRSGGKNNRLAAFLVDPSKADSATALDLQEIKQTLESIPSLNRAKQRIPGIPYKAGGSYTSSVSNMDLDLQELADEARQMLLGTYPELKQTAYETYSSFMNDFRAIRQGFTQAQLEGKIMSGFKTAEQRGAARRLLPIEIQKDIERARKVEGRAAGARGLAGKAIGGAAVGAGLGGILKLLGVNAPRSTDF